MATIRLVPSTYSLSNTSLSLSNINNAYTNTDSTTYATCSTTSTSSRYLYIRGFNFDDIPANATIDSFSIKFKANESGMSTSSSYRPSLVNNTTTITGTSSSITTTVTTQTFTGVTADWETISGYGSNFGVRFTVRRSGGGGGSSTGYLYLYGVEIEVNYTLSNPATVTSTLTGNGTLNPSGAYNTNEGAEYTLTITPTDTSEQVTATKDGVDITSELVAHYAGSDISKSPNSLVTTSGINSGSSYASYPVGHTAENPNTYSSNMYASNNSTGYAEYDFDFSDIPAGASIESIEVRCCGLRESSTTSTYYRASIGLYSGSTQKSSEQEFTSTSQQVITIDDPGTWTRAELQNARLRFTVGYYGGRLYGATWVVTYSTGSNNPEYYTYTYTVTGNSTIAVTIGSVATDILEVKLNGSWVEVVKAYKKVNGSWVEQADVTTVFNSTDNFVRGG